MHEIPLVLQSIAKIKITEIRYICIKVSKKMFDILKGTQDSVFALNPCCVKLEKVMLVSVDQE